MSHQASADTHGPTGWFWALAVRSVVKRWSVDLAKGADRLPPTETTDVGV